MKNFKSETQAPKKDMVETVLGLGTLVVGVVVFGRIARAILAPAAPATANHYYVVTASPAAPASPAA